VDEIVWGRRDEEGLKVLWSGETKKPCWACKKPAQSVVEGDLNVPWDVVYWCKSCLSDWDPDGKLLAVNFGQ
jgi:hypothetical protein